MKWQQSSVFVLLLTYNKNKIFYHGKATMCSVTIAELHVTANNIKLISVSKKTGYAVAHLVEALRYKPEGRGFDS
jgi:hypothetical protein